jgi:hypothetical protein
VTRVRFVIFIGPLARIGPNDLITSDPAVMRRMLGARSPYRRSDWYIGMRFDPARDNLESQMNDEKHTALRAKMAAGVAIRNILLLMLADVNFSTPGKRTTTLS